MIVPELLVKTARKARWDAMRRRAPAPKLTILHDQADAGQYGAIWPGRQYVVRVEGPAYIDPWFGWVITESGVLLEDSVVPQVGVLWRQPWRHGLISPAAFRQARDSGAVTTVDEALSLRHWWEWSYYHFHLDCLGKLALFHEAGVPSTVSVAVGRYADELGWARQFLNRLFPDPAQLLVPDQENRTFIRAEKAVYYCRTLQPYRTRMDFVMDQMAVPVPASVGADGRRLFITRRPPARRTASNLDEIEAIAAEKGFAIVDAAGWTADQQIQTFGEMRYLIALHGAGLTNMVFRRGAPLSILELHADTYVTEDMENIAADYGYTMNRLPGTSLKSEGKGGQHTDYHIDPQQFRNAIDALLRAK